MNYVKLLHWDVRDDKQHNNTGAFLSVHIYISYIGTYDMYIDIDIFYHLFNEIYFTYQPFLLHQ